MTTAEIQTLLDTASYSADSIEKLETYVESDQEYSFEVNRTLCKLYQFFPTRLNEAIVAKILTQSMMAFPSTDMMALLCLVSETVQESEPVASIIRCYELLDACHFKEFWVQSKSLGSSLNVPKIQSSILQVLSLSYRSAPLAVVLAAINETSLAATSFPTMIESVTADQVVFVATADNTKRLRVFQEGVKYSAITAMLAASQ